MHDYVYPDDPWVRNALLLLEWEREAPASTGPLPRRPSVYHSARQCLAPHNQPVGQGWVAALTLAASNAWLEAKARA